MSIFKKILFAMAFLLVTTSVSASVGNTISVGNYNQIVGDIFKVTLDADFTNGTLDGGALTLTWDDSILQFNSFGYDVAFDLPSQSHTSSSLKLDWANFVSPPQTGTFSLGTINFLAIGVGVSPVTASDFGSLEPASFINGSVNVTAVPVPAAVWLFASGITGFLGFMRKKPIAAA